MKVVKIFYKLKSYIGISVFTKSYALISFILLFLQQNKNIIMSNRISIELRNKARKFGLCDEWFNEWNETSSKQELIDKYIKGIDFALQHHYPSNQYIRDNFELELLRKNNILVDDERSLLNPRVAVILGNTKAKIRVNDLSRSVIYIRDNSVVDIIAKNNSFIIVHLFDNASTIIKTEDTPNILVLKHSKNIKVAAPKSVNIKEELEYLK